MTQQLSISQQLPDAKCNQDFACIRNLRHVFVTQEARWGRKGRRILDSVSVIFFPHLRDANSRHQ
jgi:hypothetical protein